MNKKILSIIIVIIAIIAVVSSFTLYLNSQNEIKTLETEYFTVNSTANSIINKTAEEKTSNGVVSIDYKIETKTQDFLGVNLTKHTSTKLRLITIENTFAYTLTSSLAKKNAKTLIEQSKEITVINGSLKKGFWCNMSNNTEMFVKMIFADEFNSIIMVIGSDEEIVNRIANSIELTDYPDTDKKPVSTDTNTTTNTTNTVQNNTNKKFDNEEDYSQGYGYKYSPDEEKYFDEDNNYIYDDETYYNDDV